MALPILAKGITSALTKKGKSAKKDDKVSAQKLLSNSTTSPAKSKVKFSKVEPRKLAPYRKKVETTKFLPPSKVDEKFSVNKLEALLTSLVGSTANLQKITKKDLGDVKKGNRTKENIKQNSKRERNEEKTESKKTVAKVSKPMKLAIPSLFGDIFKMGGRLILSLGIMELLKFLDPEKKESIFGFLTEHLDKIVLGALGILGIAFVASFLPVISMVGTILGILAPIMIGIGSFLLPILGPVLAALAAIALTAGTTAPGTLDETALDKRLAPGDRIKRIEEIYGGTPLIEWPPQVMIQYEKDIRSEGLQWKDVMPRLLENQEKFTQQQQDIVDKQSKPQAPQTQPQTPVMGGDTKLGSLSGHSGSVAYDGQEKASLSTAYSPLAQSDIDEQGLSIISGKGYRASTQSNHKGYDIPTTKGTPVYAYLPGKITRNSPASGYGNIVEWQDDVYGEKHMFAHLMAPGPLKVGEKFSAGTMLAKTGDTGTPGSYHLHWEIGAVGAEVEPGAWTKKHPIKMTPKKPPNKAQEVSSTTSYEETGTQVALLEVAVPVPMPLPGGGGGTSSGGSRSSGGIDILTTFNLSQFYSNA